MDVLVAMPDGARLMTDIYTPAIAGPWPIILLRTPYDPADQIHADRAAEYNPQGVVYIVQNSRGLFGSEGTADFFGSDKQDGRDMIRLLMAQPWCNGRIATLGHSAPGIEAYRMLPNNSGQTEELRCAWVEMATPDLHATAYENGCFRQSLVENWLSGTGQSSLLQDVVANATNASWWSSRQIATDYANVSVPTVHLTGWFDIYPKDQIDAFMGMQAAGAQSQYLIVGPWTHDEVDAQQQGQFIFPATANLQAYQLQEDWLAFYLFDQGDLSGWPVVRYYRMGDTSGANAPGNDWQTATTWPPFTNERTFYLHQGGLLDENAPTTNETPDAFTYDAANPAPTVGGGNLFMDRGPYDQTSVENRADVLTYTTAPLGVGTTLEVTGRPRARIFLQSTALDTDLLVRLSDVYPDGRSMPMAEGIIRTRFRDPGDQTGNNLMTPGQTYEISFDLRDTSIVFNAGHRVRVAITSSSDPRFEPNPNTSDAFRANTTTVTATNTIHHDQTRASAIILPTP